MKRSRSPSFQDSRGKISHILNPRTDECVAYSGISHTSRSCLGYGVAFTDDKYTNLSGSVSRDKSGYRCELRAILYALIEIARTVQSPKRPTSYIIYSSHEYAVSRINGCQDISSGTSGARNPRKVAESSITGTNTNSEVNHTPCLDFLLQIRLLIQHITQNGCTARISYTSQTTPGIAEATQLAREAITKATQQASLSALSPPDSTYIEHKYRISLEIMASVPLDEFQRVYTDGTSIANGAAVIAGYGVFFGICDPRNETGTVRGLGTGPRGALAGILRAISQIAENNNGHKKWEVVSCRGQYIKSIFELSEQWRRNGWRRSAGKAIASLDIYRAARKLLDELQAKGFEIKGTYVAQKQTSVELMAADIMARRGAGDTSIEITDTIVDGPVIGLDDGEMKVWASTEEFVTEQGPRSIWIARFEGCEQPAQGAISGNRDTLNKSLYTVTKVLRLIESKPERRWKIGVEQEEAVVLLNSSSIVSLPKHESNKKTASLLELIFSNLQRLKRHGYEISFFHSGDDD